MNHCELKLVVIGSGAVGKSCFTLNFVQGLFVEKYDPTIEDSYRKQLEVDGVQCALEILDTAGVDTFSSMRDLYYREADGVLLVYSIVSEASFKDVMEMYEALQRCRCENMPPMILVGNKSDLEDMRMVARQTGYDKAMNIGAAFCETSAKTGENVNEVFVQLVRAVLAKRKVMEKQLNGKKTKKHAACSVL